MAVTKIATCCYCGTKAALVLRGAERHELACASCGAPLHVMKAVPAARARVSAPAATPTRPQPKAAKPEYDKYAKSKSRNKPGKRKKSKSFGSKIWEEVWDVIEDVFD